MQQSPIATLVLLLFIEAGVLLLAGRYPRLFRLPPSLFWIYFLPTLAATLGLIPGQSPLYPALVSHLLPASLVLLFLSVDLGAILRLGPLALGVLGVSALGIVLGGPLVLLLLGAWLPAEAWSGLGALGASWVGGSANMLAVKASLNTPDPIFARVMVVDVVVAYAWMALLLALPGLQSRFDAWNRSRTAALDELVRRLPAGSEGRTPTARPGALLIMLLLAGGCSLLSGALASVLPEVPGAIGPHAWRVLVASALGVGLSLTRARRLEEHRASALGQLMLYLVLAGIGAQADLRALGQAPLFALAGALWLILHGSLLLLCGRLLRAPLALLATASQACVGGPISAPIVAGAFQPGLAGVGLLLAVLGNLGGTGLGLLCGLLCRAVST